MKETKEIIGSLCAMIFAMMLLAVMSILIIYHAMLGGSYAIAALGMLLLYVSMAISSSSYERLREELDNYNTHKRNDRLYNKTTT